MKHVTITFAVIALVAQTAQAGHLGFGGGGPGLGGHHGGRRQARFETRFEGFLSCVGTGLADDSSCQMPDTLAASAAPEQRAQLLSALAPLILALRRSERPPEWTA